MKNSLLLKNVQSLLDSPRLPNFVNSSRALFDHGFNVTNYEFNKEEEHFDWAIFEHPILQISVKLTPNKFFGCKFSDIKDPKNLL